MTKICTDISQSQKLIELGIDANTADMCWANHLFNAFLSSWRIESTPPQEYKNLLDSFAVRGYLIEPAWSLSALLDILPTLERKGYQKAKPQLLYNVAINKWIVDSHVYTTNVYDNPVDACYEMVCWLKENKKI